MSIFGVGTTSLVVFLVLLVWQRRDLTRLQTLTNNSEDILAFHDPKGRFLYANPAMQTILGHTSKEVLRQPLQDFVHPDDAKALAVVLRNEENARLTARFRHKDGFYVWLEMYIRFLTTAAGKVGRITTTSRNVTEQRRTMEMHRYLARNLPRTGVFLLDQSFRILFAEGDVLKQNDWARESLEGYHLRDLMGSTHMRVVTPHLKSALQGHQMEVEGAFQGFIYHVHLSPVWVDDTVTAVMVVAHDVTDQKQSEAVLRERTDDLERSNRDLEQFADIASHELKSPLRHISGFAELLAEEHEGLLSDDADEYIDNIVEGVQEMQRVIEALLTYSRAKMAEDRMTLVDMEAVLGSVLDSLQPRIQQSGGQVTLLGGPFPHVFGDEVLLRQLLENLIGNGIKFSGPKPVVSVLFRRELLEWEFTILDNGPGVAPEHRESIFQMFKRSRTDVEGSGVGLALCQKIVGIHRGRLWVEDGPGDQGAAFKFTLPARNREETYSR